MNFFFALREVEKAWGLFVFKTLKRFKTEILRKTFKSFKTIFCC